MLSFGRNGSNLESNASPKVCPFPNDLHSLMDHLDVPAGPPVQDRSRTIKTKIPISKDSIGCPALPSITRDSNFKTKIVQSMLREYCIAHIREPFIVYHAIVSKSVT